MFLYITIAIMALVVKKQFKFLYNIKEETSLMEYLTKLNSDVF